MKLFKNGTLIEWIKELGLVPGVFIVDNTVTIDKLDPDLTNKVNAIGNGGTVVANDLVQTVPGKALDAVQGRILKLSIDNLQIPTLPVVVNNLSTTSTGSVLDASQGKLLDDKLTILKGGVPSAGDTLNKLYSLIQSINAIIGAGTSDGDTVVNTVTELLAVFATYQEQVDLAQLLNSKVSGTVINTLSQTASGTVLDGRQGKALYDLITALTTNVNGINQLVKLDGTGRLPAIDGSQLLNLPTGGSATPLTNNLTTSTTGTALDAVQGKVLNDIINTLKGGSNVTIATLVSQLSTLNNLVTGTTADGDSIVNTIQELLSIFSTYPEGLDVATVIGGKVDIINIVNNLTTTATGKVLDARQGKALKDLVDGLTSSKQDALVSGTNIKTINGQSVLGTGNITIGGGTLPFLLVTSFTSAAIQSAIDSAASNATIYLMPGTYNVTSTITFGGKTNVTIDGLNAATLSGTGNLIVLNGDTTNCCFREISFMCTATGGGGQGLVSSNELGAHKNFLVDRCNFDSPTYRLNGFSVNTYSATADGGSGTGKMFDGLHFSKCKFGCNGGLGRMGLEVLNHAWSDNKLDLYLKNITISECTFRDLGKVAESDGTTFNGMAASISGRCIDLKVDKITVTDSKAYGLEIVGTQGAVVTNCTFDYINNSYIPVSLADGYGNGSDATRDITISNCYMRSKTRPMNSRGTTGLALSNITWIGTTNDNSNGSSLYFQKCVDVVIKGGRLSCGSYNPLRFDDCKEVVIDLPRITGTNTSFNYASISIYSGTGYTGAGSQDYRIGINGGIFKKNNGITTTPGSIYETQGTVTGVVTF